LKSYFKAREFACKCGCGLSKPSAVLLNALNDLRALAGVPITITGPLRCESHNRAQKLATNSRHCPPHCDGVDIVIKGRSVKEMALLALQIPAFRNGGVGLYSNRIHVDTRGKAARWAHPKATVSWPFINKEARR
jgi:uncharacterized protein YcbK (DUF882 family)